MLQASYFLLLAATVVKKQQQKNCFLCFWMTENAAVESCTILVLQKHQVHVNLTQIMTHRHARNIKICSVLFLLLIVMQKPTCEQIRGYTTHVWDKQTNKQKGKHDVLLS